MPRLLFADDSRDLRTAAGIVFNAASWDVTTVGNGAEALQVWSPGDFDVVVLDVRMPEVDGVAVADRLRAEGWDGPIVLWTNWDEAISRDHAEELDLQVLPKLQVHILRTFVTELHQ